ncbi:MAG: prepilin-type N-terminal cleavage/methylation domain-containing protein [Burkholderiales bacterium]
MSKRHGGFTLIEIAIVLVIIGLLLGGVLKGQELITAARVRNFIQEEDAVKAAYFGFLDRYRALPGDYANAATTITGISTVACNGGNGNGDGQITGANNEDTLVWEHLSKAGFIAGTYTCAAAVTVATSPVNPYGQYFDLIYDANYAGATAWSRHNLKSGAQVPPDILSEIDRKIDDGIATQGAFRAELGGGVDATISNCYSPAGVWATNTGGSNCGAATLF